MVLKIIQIILYLWNDTNRIVYSETVILSDGYFKKNYTLKNHNPIIEAILIAVTAGILITGCLF